MQQISHNQIKASKLSFFINVCINVGNVRKPLPVLFEKKTINGF